MRGREIPFGIGPAFAHDDAVTHVERDHHQLSGVGADGTFPEDHVTEVDIVVRGPDVAFDAGPVDLVHDLRGFSQHHLPVEAGIGLGDDHIGEVAFEVLVHEVPGSVGVALGNAVPFVEHLQSEMA